MEEGSGLARLATRRLNGFVAEVGLKLAVVLVVQQKWCQGQS